MNEMTSYEMGAIIGSVVGLVVCYAILIAGYILCALGLQTLAKRRTIPCPWLAWIPVVNAWTIGNLADDYDEKCGINRNFRTLLLVTNILTMGIGFFAIPMTVVMTMFLENGHIADEKFLVGYFIIFYVVVIILSIVGTLAQIMTYICLYKIFESTRPEKAVKYMILSLLVPLAQQICIFLCRNYGYDTETYNRINGKTAEEDKAEDQNIYTIYQPPQDPEN